MAHTAAERAEAFEQGRSLLTSTTLRSFGSAYELNEQVGKILLTPGK
jgi:hypothetical protein